MMTNKKNKSKDTNDRMKNVMMMAQAIENHIHTVSYLFTQKINERSFKTETYRQSFKHSERKNINNVKHHQDDYVQNKGK